MKIGYDKALEIAKAKRNDIKDYCEYADAYVFGNNEERTFGGNGPVVVLKDGGRCVNMPYYTSVSRCVDVISEGRI